MVDETQNLRGDAGGTDADPEKTLAAPRFDAREVVTAQPVVPLDGARLPRPARRQGTLPLVLILISALVGGLVSVLAYRLYQQRAGQSSARAEQLPAFDAPPVTPTLAPPPETSAAAETSSTPEVIEEEQPDLEVAEVREAEMPDDATAAREEAREDRAGRELDSAKQREARAEQTAERPAARANATRRPAARRVEEITTPTEDLRVRRERYDGREASGYEAPRRTRAERRAERRAARRAARRDGERNIDRVRAIFEGPPPGQ